jgi:ABC-type nitrate/sulfonate/bicarbonate transport system substrate-binding protein
MARLNSTRWLAGALSCALVAAFGAPGAEAQQRDKITIVIFGPPSLGAFLPPLIKAQKLDEANGLDITFEERPPDAYVAQFNSGEFKVGGSASLMTVGLADVRGVKVSYLFNLFDFWAAVVTNKGEVKTLKDLEGRQLAAARATTSYLMFEWLAKKQGVDTAKIKVVNTAPPGLISFALADRADAVQVWEPAYTILISRKPDIRTLDSRIPQTWKGFTGGTDSRIPYLGVAAHHDWIEQNKALIPRLYKAYEQASKWLVANPEAAAKLISPKSTPTDQAALAKSILANDRLGLSLASADEVRNEIRAVYRAGIESGFLPKGPSEASIYGGKVK